MIEAVISFSIQAVSILLCSISLYLAILIYKEYRSTTSIRLISIASALIIWTGLFFVSNLLAENLISNTLDINTLQHIATLGLAFLFAAFAIVAYIQISPIYNKKVRFAGAIALGCYIILVGFALAEIEEAHGFIVFKRMNAIWVLQFDALVNFAMFFGGLAFFLSFYYSSMYLDNFPNYLLSQQKINLNKKVLYLLGSTIIICFIFFVFGPLETSSYMGLVIELFLSFLGLAYLYFSYEQPFLQIGYGANAFKLLENHFVGYFIGTSLDSGPTIINKSDRFFELSKIDQTNLEGLNVGLMTLVGINDSFREQLSIVPVPQYDEFMTIAISFFIQNPEVKDNRVKKNAPSVLGIVVPSVLALNLLGINEVKTQIKELFAEYDHIEKLSDKNLEGLVGKLLHELLY